MKATVRMAMVTLAGTSVSAEPSAVGLAKAEGLAKEKDGWKP